MDLAKILMKENLVYVGKSKEVYNITEGEYARKYAFVFTDRGTGYIDENNNIVFDPGYDTVVGEIPGKGTIACKFARYFFELLKEKNIPSHYIETINDNVMIVEPANVISMPAESPEFDGSAPLQNIEWTWRNNATGSFWRRYPFVRPGKNLHTVVEAWTKGESDILIAFEALEAAGVMTRDEIDYVDKLVKNIASVITQDFEAKGLHIIDGKFELGRLKYGDGKIVLIDEISPDVIRACDGYIPDEEGNCNVYEHCIETKLLDGKRTIIGRKQLNASELKKAVLG